MNPGKDLPTLAVVRNVVALQRYGRLGQALLIALAAYAAALSINSAIAMWLDRGIPEVAPPADYAAVDSQTIPELAARPDHSVIFDRNLFGSEPIVVAERAPSATPSDLRLRGTADLDGQAFAVIEDGAGGHQDVFGVGERVFGEAKLVSVKPGKATLLQRGRRFTLEITEPEPPEADAGKGKKGAAGSGPGSGIRKTGENRYVVERREVEHSVENLNSVITQMRAVPFLRDGKGIGFRVFNIKPGSLFERMGLKNGDVVESVNGVELNTPSKAVGLLENVQTADEILVNLLRGGQRQTMTYTIR